MACRLGSAFITAGDGCLTPGLSDTDLEYEDRTFDTLLLKYLLVTYSSFLFQFIYWQFIIIIISLTTLLLIFLHYRQIQTCLDMYESNLNKFVNILNEMCLYVIKIMPRE